MAIKTYKPTTPSRRHMTVSAFEGIDKKAKPERSLTEVLSKHAGRNSYGLITVRHRGGGNKQKYRIIDFKRDKEGKATVVNLQYDPNRSANIALIEYEDGERRYILAPNGLKAGHIIMTGPDADILPGNCLPIANIPVGEMIHNIELYPGKGAQLVRAAGVAAQLMAKENGMAQVRLRVPVRRCWQRRSQARQSARSSLFPDQILWRCSSVSEHRVCVTCLRRRRKMRRASSLSMRLMRSERAVTAATAEVMMSVSRR